MEPTLYVYGPNLVVSGSGDPSFDGTYQPGIANAEVPGAQWIKGTGENLRFILKDGNTWFIGGNNGYASVINSQWPWDTDYITDGADGPAPTVTRTVITIQEALDALQLKFNG
jgi:hypothetical protein